MTAHAFLAAAVASLTVSRLVSRTSAARESPVWASFDRGRMATITHIRTSAAAALILAAALAPNALADGGKAVDPQAIEGYAVARSYAAGDVVHVVLLGKTADARAAVFHAGFATSNAAPRGEMPGAPVAAKVAVSARETRVAV